MTPIGILILPVFVTVGVLAAANPRTKFCVFCHGNPNPALCTTMVRCQADESCFTDVRHHNGKNHFIKGCRKTSECNGYSQPNLLCMTCCEHNNCNQHKCEDYILTTTKAPTATFTSSSTATATTTSTQPYNTVTVGVPAAARKSCVLCHGRRNPALCTTMVECQADEECNGYSHTDLLCMKCCEHSYCNQYRFGHFILTTSKAPPATSSTSSTTATATTTSTPTTPTTPPSTTGSNLCRNHEDDGVTCTSMAHYNFCSVQDPTALSYDIAHNKCAKYCGFCGTTQTARVQTTLSSTCMDHEVGGFRCADYDQYNICTDVSSVALSIAHNQCQKHCGLCGSQHTTGAPNTVTMTSFNPLTTATGYSQVQITTSKPCVDREDSIFSCASWANNGFCQTTSGMLRDVTVYRCSKYCGLC